MNVEINEVSETIEMRAALGMERTLTLSENGGSLSRNKLQPRLLI